MAGGGPWNGLLAFSATASSSLGPIYYSGQHKPHIYAELSAVIAVEVAEHVR